jgi:nitrile hydratase accessory protein
MSLAEQALPGQPHDGHAPVFSAPWEAQVFAMVLALYERGLFTWTEWARALTDEISRAAAAGDPDRGDTYYQHWLNALERLIAAKGVTSTDELARAQRAWDHAADRTPHGQPIVLNATDYDD